MAIPAHVIFAAERAQAVIEEETYQSVNSETGGLLVGRLIDYNAQPVLVVVAATGPGPGADKRPLYYGSDPYYLQCTLVALRDEFSSLNVDYVGEWHKHPPDVPYLSQGDIEQARRILRDPDYRLQGGGLLLPLTRLRETGDFEQHCFYLARGIQGPVEIRSSTVAQDATLRDLLTEVLNLSESGPLEQREQRVNSVFYSNPRGKKECRPTRLGRDVERLDVLKASYAFEAEIVGGSAECVDLSFPVQALYLNRWPDALSRNKRPYLNSVSVKFMGGYPKDPVIKVCISGQVYSIEVTSSKLKNHAPLDHLLKALFGFLLKESDSELTSFRLSPAQY
jgi:hypothetical protein